MSVKFLGIELVPVEGWLVRAFHTLMKKDELAWFDLWKNDDGEKWEYDGQPRDVPILQPDQHGESGQYRMFVSDTNEGRKVVLYWSGMTVPVIDFSANDGHVDHYIEHLRCAAEELRFAAPSKSYRTQRKYETNADVVEKWADLVEHSRQFRNSVIGYEYLPDEGVLVPSGHAFLDSESMEYGLTYKDPEVDYLKDQLEVTEVGGSFYYRDIKVFRSTTAPGEAHRLSEWCYDQSQLALAKYLVTGLSGDYEHFLERRLKSKINRLTGFSIVKASLSAARAGVSKLKAKLMAALGLAPGDFFNRIWGAANRRVYLDHYRKTGEWKTPDDLDCLVGAAKAPGVFFDHLLHTTGSGTILSSEFLRVKDSCAVDREIPEVFLHQKLLKYLPAEGTSFYRDKSSAWAHWAQKGITKTEAPVAIPRPVKDTIGAANLFDI